MSGKASLLAEFCLLALQYSLGIVGQKWGDIRTREVFRIPSFNGVISVPVDSGNIFSFKIN